MNDQQIQKRLSEFLEFPVPTDLVKYITNIKSANELENHLKTLLNQDNPRHREFINQLKNEKESSTNQAEYSRGFNNSYQSKNQKKKNKKKQKLIEVAQPEPVDVKPPQREVKPEIGDKKKPKFVNLYSQEGSSKDVILLKGRHLCNCEARRHKLINNCQNCGRIVCAQENAGPCFFCEELVCSPEQQAVLSNNSRQSQHLQKQLMSQKPGKSFQDTIKQRDVLLECDRNSLQFTKVIDDEFDYYQSTNKWLSPMERERLQKYEEEMNAKKHESRLTRKVTLDFAGRKLIDEDDPVNAYTEEQFKALLESIPPDEHEQPNICPYIEFDAPKYIEVNNLESRRTRSNVPLGVSNRIQDKEYLEITDEGLCLSMHQPYASLLVAGIKTHEGRSWYTSHRGRLWIASASKVPSDNDIKELQQIYRTLKGDNVKFPESYPTGVLLGCVTVVDVLPQEEYRKIYPHGESESPYVFICENPCAFPIKYPIQGKHKIYKMDPKIHQAGLKSLERLLKGSNM